MTLSRRLLLAGCVAIGAAFWSGSYIAAQAPRSSLLLVIDGLRPDYVTPEIMPRLHALGQRGIVFEAHHSVFPTVTRVNSSSISTGSYPETHGLLGNTIYSEKTFPGKPLDTSEQPQLAAMEKADGRLLTAPTLGESLDRAGKKMLVISAGSTGSAFLLNHPFLKGAVVHPELFQPEGLKAQITAAVGAGPEEAVPNNKRNKWIVDVYLSLGLNQLKSDVTAMWFGDPDSTAHAKGVGTPETRQALGYVDAEIGRIEDTLRQRGLLDRTNILVASDHGFSTHTSELKLAALVAPFAKTQSDGTPDIVVTEGAVNFRGSKDPARVAAVVADLQKRPEVGAIFTRPDGQGSMKGGVPGTLSFNVARWNHARSAEILVSANWSADKNAAGYAGRTTQNGVAGHGTSSPYDIHNTLIAAGPDFKEHVTSSVPTSNVDLAPTILKMLGLPVPSSMTGRVIEEGLRSGPMPGSIRVEHAIETAKTTDGGYQVDAHTSTVTGHRYLDYTEVRRAAR